MAESENQVELALGRPVFASPSTEFSRAKKSVVILSAALLFFEVNGVSVTDWTFLGLSLDGITNENIRLAALAVLTYLVLSYLWLAWDYVLELRIRITGSRIVFSSGSMWGSRERDETDDTKQSSLYNWWVQRSRELGSVRALVRQMQQQVDEWSQRCEDLLEKGIYNKETVDALAQNKEELRNTAQNIERKMKASESIATSDRIAVSLRRFDNWFRCFNKSQLGRVVVFDFLVPLVTSVSAIVVCICRMV